MVQGYISDSDVRDLAKINRMMNTEKYLIPNTNPGTLSGMDWHPQSPDLNVIEAAQHHLIECLPKQS